jgi:transcriptional regulator with XRE-family HTH domain
VIDQPESIDFNARVGANIKRLRAAAGLSQADLAHQLTERGFPFQQQTILKVEKGIRPLKLEEAQEIAEILRTNTAQLSEHWQNGEIAAALAQLRNATDRTVTRRRQIAELEDENSRDAALMREAERHLVEAGATQDDEGRWHWKAADGSHGMHIPEGAPLPPKALQPSRSREERRQRALAALEAEAADQSNSNG